LRKKESKKEKGKSKRKREKGREKLVPAYYYAFLHQV
jgi:hypothetical protein